MNKKDLEDRNQIILLIDIYGDLLTEKQKRILELYFFDDLSLVEISKINNSSRQSILYSIDKSINQLKIFEEKMKILERDREFKIKKEILIKELGKSLDYNSNIELYNFIKNM